MNKKRAIIIAAVIVTIILISIAVYLATSKPDQYKSCSQMTKEQKNYVLALKTKDASYCSKTGNPEFCNAYVTGNIEFCNTQKNKNYCLAIIKGDEILCEENDWWCKADASRNPDYCDNLPLEEQPECQSDIMLNEEYYNQKICD